MASLAPQISQPTHDIDGSVKIIRWGPMIENTDGVPVSIPWYTTKTVTFSGAFTTATMILQGSNDGATWFPLTDPQGNAISRTAEGIETIDENPLFIRPLISGGAAGTSITVIICARRENPLRT